MTIENAVSRHYGNPELEERILDAIRDSGLDPEHLDPDDLLAVDQFHVGGVHATRELVGAAGITRGRSVLDIGSGIGGPARFFAHHHGATVVGIDLTPEFVQTATSLTARTGLSESVAFVEGSALALPFADDDFDVATVLHVGMNIADKDALVMQAARVLRPGGVLAVYDIMRIGDGEPAYPLPWAASADISFPATPDAYRRALEAAGFSVELTRKLRSEGIDFASRRLAGAPSPLGMHLVLGPDGPLRMKNLLEAMVAGSLAPVQMIARLD